MFLPSDLVGENIVGEFPATPDDGQQLAPDGYKVIAPHHDS